MSRNLLALAFLLAVVVPSAAQAKRAALVIGISDYQHLSSLINPVPTPRRSPPSFGILDRPLIAV
jgi:hypothetical protein